MDDLEFEEYERRYESATASDIMMRAVSERLTLDQCSKLLEEAKAELVHGRPLRDAMWGAGKAASRIQGEAMAKFINALQPKGEFLPVEIQVSVQPEVGPSYSAPTSVIDYNATAEFPRPKSNAVGSEPVSFELSTDSAKLEAFLGSFENECIHVGSTKPSAEQALVVEKIIVLQHQKIREAKEQLMVGACPGCNGTGVRTSPVCPSLDLYSHSQCMICEGK